MILGVGVPTNAIRPFWTSVTLANASARGSAGFHSKAVDNWRAGETTIGWDNMPVLQGLLATGETHAEEWLRLLTDSNIEAASGTSTEDARTVRKAAIAQVKQSVGGPGGWRDHVRSLARSSSASTQFSNLSAPEHELASLREELRLAGDVTEQFLRRTRPDELVGLAETGLAASVEALSDGRYEEAHTLLQESLERVGRPTEVDLLRFDLVAQMSFQIAHTCLAEAFEIRISETGLVFPTSPGFSRYRTRVNALATKAVDTLVNGLRFVVATNRDLYAKFNRLLEPSVILAVKSSADFSEAAATCEKLRSLEMFRQHGLHSMLIWSAGNRTEAEAAFRGMLEVGMEPTLRDYELLIQRSHDFEFAQSTFSELIAKGIPPRLNTLHLLLSNAGTPEQAAVVMAQMESYGLAPTVQTYNLRIGAAASYQRALGLIREMKDSGLMPDVATYEALRATATTAEEALEAMRLGFADENIPTRRLTMSRDALVQFLKRSGFYEP